MIDSFTYFRYLRRGVLFFFFFLLCVFRQLPSGTWFVVCLLQHVSAAVDFYLVFPIPVSRWRRLGWPDWLASSAEIRVLVSNLLKNSSQYGKDLRWMNLNDFFCWKYRVFCSRESSACSVVIYAGQSIGTCPLIFNKFREPPQEVARANEWGAKIPVHFLPTLSVA